MSQAKQGKHRRVERRGGITIGRAVPWLLAWALLFALWMLLVATVDPLEVGGRDARSITRRALITAGASLAPNRYVIDFDRTEGRVLVHELVARREDLVP